MATLQDQTKPSNEQLLAMVDALKAENLKLRQRGNNIKVSAKGAISVYGLGRFPVTLYLSQWERLLAMKPELEAFFVANVDKLSTKED